MTPFSRIFFKPNFFFYTKKKITENILCLLFSVTIYFAVSYGPDQLASLRRRDRFRIPGGTCRATWGSSACKYIRVSIHLIPVCRLRAARRDHAATVITRVTRHSVRSRTLPLPSHRSYRRWDPYRHPLSCQPYATPLNHLRCALHGSRVVPRNTKPRYVLSFLILYFTRDSSWRTQNSSNPSIKVLRDIKTSSKNLGLPMLSNFSLNNIFLIYKQLFFCKLRRIRTSDTSNS